MPLWPTRSTTAPVSKAHPPGRRNGQRHLERPVRPAKIVPRDEQRQHQFVIRPFLAECVGQPSAGGWDQLAKRTRLDCLRHRGSYPKGAGRSPAHRGRARGSPHQKVGRSALGGPSRPCLTRRASRRTFGGCGRIQTRIVNREAVEAAVECDFSGIPERNVCAANRVGSRVEVPRRLGVLAGAGKCWIDRFNGCTFVIGRVPQRPTKIHLGNVG
jgi:hypothetical protein